MTFEEAQLALVYDLPVEYHGRGYRKIEKICIRSQKCIFSYSLMLVDASSSVLSLLKVPIEEVSVDIPANL